MDFEVLSAREEAVHVDEAAMREAVRGLEGARARRVGMKVWLDRARGKESPGEVWTSGRFLVGAGAVILMFLAGIAVMTGMLDRDRMAFHVPMVLGLSVGLPLLILVAGGLAWLVRGKLSRGFGFFERLLGWLIGKFSGAEKMGWWRELRLEGGKGWEALGWNLVRLTQAGAVMFSLGLMAGLLGCIWFFEVGFYWESTTPEWMAARIYEVCGFLSAPWGWAWQGGVVSIMGIAGTMWTEEGVMAGRMQSAATWYPFLFATIFVWGLLPRVVLWVVAFLKERRALGALNFQSRRHRELWREVMGTRRSDVSEIPLDGVLVLDVGGTGLKREDLRGFLLRRLRVNPGEWYEVGVWDEKGEVAATESIRSAPAGVVLLAEGWALSPPRMEALHAQVRNITGDETAIYFLVVNAGNGGLPAGVKEEEKEIWRDFVDGLADASAETFFYEEEEA